MGRPTKLTAEVQKQVVDLIRQFNYAETAAGCAGIGKSTYYRWMKQGEEEPGPYRDFRDAVRIAEAETETKAVAMVQDSAPGDWKAARWFLERRFPSRWGNQRQSQAEPTGDNPIVIRIVTPEKAA